MRARGGHGQDLLAPCACCGRPAEANGHPHSSSNPSSPAAPPGGRANGVASSISEPWHACLDNHSYSRGGSREHSLSLQKSSISANSLRTESAHSLVNNESLGLDERAVFESFNKAGLHARRCACPLRDCMHVTAATCRHVIRTLLRSCLACQPAAQAGACFGRG